MPRIADKHLHDRILDAAQELWRKQGEKGLTLRAVARRASTTTTTVYKRFRNKKALQVAIAERVRSKIIAVVTSSPDIEEAILRYLQFAETHPHEYQLMWGTSWPEIFSKRRPRPVQIWMMSQLAERFGGEPKDYAQAYSALFLSMHGSATLLAGAPKNPGNLEPREWCVAITGLVIRNVAIFRS